MDKNNIELRSEEVQEILSRPPHSLVRYGISVICGVILIIFIGSFFFKYPDIVEGEILITTENPPVWIIAKSSGYISELLCRDKQLVDEGELLAVIDNPANLFDILTLKELLKELVITDSLYIYHPNLSIKNFVLGEIQVSFSSFKRNMVDYENFTNKNLIEQEKKSISKHIVEQKKYLNNLNNQFILKKKEIDIAEKTYNRESQLFDKGVISTYSFETAEQLYLSQQQSLHQLLTTISQASITIIQLEEQYHKLSVQYISERKQLFTSLKSSHEELLTSIYNWEQKYLLYSPEKGIITFNSYWKENQFINNGNKVFAVISENPGLLIGKVKTPASGSGKIKNNQSVNVKLNGYPYMEFGTLSGIVNNISLVPNDEYYTVEVNFPRGLITSVHREINFVGELSGTAEIITENRSLIERLFTPLIYLSQKYF